MATKRKVKKMAGKSSVKKRVNNPVKKKKVKLKVLGKSVLVEDDLKKREYKMGLRAPRGKHGEISIFYRKFVFKCGKCVNEFEHTAEIPIIEQMIICPKCEKMHKIRIAPIAGHYEIEFPRSIKEVKERMSRRK